jgi:hypothetical protein
MPTRTEAAGKRQAVNMHMQQLEDDMSEKHTGDRVSPIVT